MKTALFRKFGPPADCVEITEIPTPKPAPHQVRLRMHYAPIHPSDLNLIEGIYGILPELPACPGGEASATIDAVGSQVSDAFTIGTAVILPQRPAAGTWSEYLLVDPEKIHLLPTGIDLEQASMLALNPATAWGLLELFVTLSPGDWIILNAANSAVGYCLIQLARERGLKTIALVRREETMPELLALGADLVLLDQADSIAQAREAFGKQAPRLALNAVGGDSALRLMDLLADEGMHVTYGAMSRRSLKVPNKFLIFKRLTLTGFWVTRWLESADKEEITTMLKQLAELMNNKKLHMAVGEVFPIDQVQAAILAAQGDRRAGKILLKF
ncbi:MAG: 2-enoyl thioester reductase domain-containing protein [Verrucomicrobiales bacterium]|nr:2-enoyl thioester reductase domain-containing protein [Verrucomicrobiales bacterium]